MPKEQHQPVDEIVPDTYEQIEEEIPETQSQTQVPETQLYTGGAAGGAASGAASGALEDQQASQNPFPVAIPIKTEKAEPMPTDPEQFRNWPFCAGINLRGDCALSVGGNVLATHIKDWKNGHRCTYCLDKLIKRRRQQRDKAREKKQNSAKKAVDVGDKSETINKTIKKTTRAQERKQKWGHNQLGKIQKEKELAKLKRQITETNRQERGKKREEKAKLTAAALPAPRNYSNAPGKQPASPPPWNDAENNLVKVSATGKGLHTRFPSDSSIASSTSSKQGQSSGVKKADHKKPKTQNTHKTENVQKTQNTPTGLGTRLPSDSSIASNTSSHYGESSGVKHTRKPPKTQNMPKTPKTPSKRKKPEGGYSDDEAEEVQVSRKLGYHVIGNGTGPGTTITSRRTSRLLQTAEFKNGQLTQEGRIYMNDRGEVAPQPGLRRTKSRVATLHNSGCNYNLRSNNSKKKPSKPKQHSNVPVKPYKQRQASTEDDVILIGFSDEDNAVIDLLDSDESEEDKKRVSDDKKSRKRRRPIDSDEDEEEEDNGDNASD
jgi:hypothetical protein